MFKKGTVIGQLEEANFVEHGDPLWKILMEGTPESAEDKSVARMSRISNWLKQLDQELKISDRCPDTERKQLLDSLFEHEQAFALSDKELGKLM